MRERKIKLAALAGAMLVNLAVAGEFSVKGGKIVDDDATEADALESLAAIPKDCPASGAFATSFRYAKASTTNKYGDVEYRLA